MALDEFQVKLLQSIGEQALGKPMTHEAMSQLKGFINVVMDSYGVETPYATINYTDGNGKIYSTTTLNDEWFDTSNYSYKRVLNDKHIASFVSTTAMPSLYKTVFPSNSPKPRRGINALPSLY